MCHQWTTQMTFVRKFFQVDQSGSTLLGRCYMTYTTSNVLRTVFINKNMWMDIYRCILLRGLRTGYRARNGTLG